MSESLPHFIIAGAPRSGTGWMLACLKEHPEVHIPHHEVDYFSYEYDRPADWYREHFADCASDQKSGEKSPSYLAHPNAPVRIHDWNPDVQLFFSLRHPVERAYSMYCMLLQNPHRDIDEDVARALTPESAMVQGGRYAEHLKRYRNRFPDEQLHVFVFDDLKDDPRRFLRALYEAVGVDPSFEPSVLDRKYGHRKKRGGRLWSQIQEWSMRLARASDTASRWIQWVRRKGWTDWIHRMRPGKEYPPLSESLRERLSEHYIDDVNWLRSYLGRDLPGWPGTSST